MRIRFFRIFYSTTFTILGLALTILLLITPANLIYEAFLHRQIYSIIIVAGVYILTFGVSVVLYASRLYANRRALLHIPKAWSPLEKGHVEKRVRKLVAEKLEETAVIAYQCRPRNLSKDAQPHTEDGTTSTVPEHDIQPEQPTIPPWGIISHPGWSSPSSPDLPHLQLDPIIHELSNLIEAKAVSLAPPDSLYSSANAPSNEPPLPDALIVEVLQRPATMGLRDYFAHLTDLGMLNQPDLSSRFLALYEKARFSGTPISEDAFRHLMALFADILRSLQPLDPSIISQIHADNASLLSTSDQEADVYNDTRSTNSENTVQHTPHPERYYTPRPERYSLSSGSEAGSEGSVRTAPSHPTTSRRELLKASRSSSATKGFMVGTASQSQRSLKTKKSTASSIASQRSGGSVIRLAEARTELDLPYTIIAPDETGL
ncbi:MAG: hypothetical protein Q9209_004877 [Squamulea sp. 1 TL-2023]